MDQTTNTTTKTRTPRCAWCGTETGPLQETPGTSLNCQACEHRHLLMAHAGRDLTSRLLEALHAAHMEWAAEWAHVQAPDGSFTVLEGAEESGLFDFKAALLDREEQDRNLSVALRAGSWRQQRLAEQQAREAEQI